MGARASEKLTESSGPIRTGPGRSKETDASPATEKADAPSTGIGGRKAPPKPTRMPPGVWPVQPPTSRGSTGEKEVFSSFPERLERDPDSGKVSISTPTMPPPSPVTSAEVSSGACWNEKPCSDMLCARKR